MHICVDYVYYLIWINLGLKTVDAITNNDDYLFNNIIVNNDNKAVLKKCACPAQVYIFSPNGVRVEPMCNRVNTMAFGSHVYSVYTHVYFPVTFRYIRVNII